MLFVYCNDHPVAVCPQCSKGLRFDMIGADPLLGRREFCPACRADLTAALREHLTECTWMRVQARETRERAQEIRRTAQEIVKESQRLRDNADVLAREAEAAQEKSRRAKQGQPPPISA